MKVIFSILVSLAAVATLQAQPYTVDWFTIDGGGGTSSGGAYSISGTAGQPDAGTLGGGSYNLVGGFWGIATVLQTAQAPFLSPERVGGSVRVFWPKPAAGFVLQQSSAVTGGWSQVVFPYTTNATEISITVSPTGERFYRLRNP